MTHIKIDDKENNKKMQKQISSVEQLSNLLGNRLPSPKLNLPEPKDNLWVVKPIGQYEPMYLEENITKTIGKTPDDIPEVYDSTKKERFPEFFRQEIQNLINLFQMRDLISFILICFWNNYVAEANFDLKMVVYTPAGKTPE